jgi:hypothetical protein
MSSVDPTPRQLWQAARGPLVVAAVVLLGAFVLALVARGPGSGRLDPRAPEPSGGRAVAEVLRDQGVRVDLVTTTAGLESAARPGDTVLVVDPALLVEQQARAVRQTGADLVVLAPPDPGRFTPAVTAADPTDQEVRQPGCALPAARRAGTAETGGLGWVVDAEAADEVTAQCYARDGKPSLVRVRDGDRTVTVLGTPAPLTNRHLGEEGNAALALGLLGENPRLVWYLPSLSDVPADTQQRSFYGLVPDGVWWGLVQLAVAVLLLALWRARRLGPVVAEPLPVVVRAAETVEGRARLYRRGGARDTAAEALRSGLRSRLVPRLGLSARAQPPAVVDAVATRTRRPPSEVATLLYGAAPADDAALVRLADDLDALEREVSRP